MDKKEKVTKTIKTLFVLLNAIRNASVELHLILLCTPRYNTRRACAAI